MPIRRTFSTPAVNEARQPIHTSRSLPADRPVTRGAVSLTARGSGPHRMYTPTPIEEEGGPGGRQDSTMWSPSFLSLGEGRVDNSGGPERPPIPFPPFPFFPSSAQVFPGNPMSVWHPFLSHILRSDREPALAELERSRRDDVSCSNILLVRHHAHQAQAELTLVGSGA